MTLCWSVCVRSSATGGFSSWAAAAAANPSDGTMRYWSLRQRTGTREPRTGMEELKTSQEIVHEGWLIKSPPTKLWRAVCTDVLTFFFVFFFRPRVKVFFIFFHFFFWCFVYVCHCYWDFKFDGLVGVAENLSAERLWRFIWICHVMYFLRKTLIVRCFGIVFFFSWSAKFFKYIWKSLC